MNTHDPLANGRLVYHHATRPPLAPNRKDRPRLLPGLGLLAGLALALFLSACASHSAADAFILGRMRLGMGEFASTNNVLREGDVIQISFEGSTNLNSTQRIPLDGEINLQVVGKVKAAGRTVSDLEALLTVLYQSQIKPTEITVTMVTPAAVVYVAGAVLKPGKIPMDRPLTVLDAVMEAGGLDNSRAKLTAVTLLRIEDGQRRAYQLNLKEFLAGKESNLIYLKPFDIIYVPERTFNF